MQEFGHVFYFIAAAYIASLSEFLQIQPVGDPERDKFWNLEYHDDDSLGY